MKSYFLMILILFGSISYPLEKQNTEKGHQKIIIGVRGMVCAFCSQGIHKKFSAQKGVSKVKVNLDKQIVVLGTKKNFQLTNRDIARLVSEAGFNLVRIKRK